MVGDLETYHGRDYTVFKFCLAVGLGMVSNNVQNINTHNLVNSL